MATRSNVSRQQTAVGEEEGKTVETGVEDTTATEETSPVSNESDLSFDDLPDEMNDEPASNGSSNSNGHMVTPSGSSENNIGLSLDELNDTAFDNERDEKERAKLDPPAGDWQKSERWVVTASVYTADSMPGDTRPEGRTTYTVQGKPDTITLNSLEYCPGLFFRLSPDPRNKMDDPSKRDNSYKLFLKAKDAYLSLKGERCPSEKALINFLRDADYVVRTMKGENGPVVVDIKGKRFAAGSRR